MKAVFHRDFRFDRPNSPHCFDVRASKDEQSWPRDVVAAAIEAGAATATELASPKAAKTARKGRKKQDKPCEPSRPDGPYDGDLL